MKIKILFLQFFLCLYGFSQTNSDIIKETKTAYNTAKTNTDKAKLAGDISWNYLQISIDSAEVYGKKALQLAKLSKNDTLIANALNDFANVYFAKGDFQKTIELSDKSILLKIKLNDKKGLASLYTKKANSFVQLSDYKKAMLFYIKANRLFENIGDIENAMHVQTNISSCYYRMANDQKAIEYLKKPIEYFKTTKNYFYLTNAKINLALLLKKEKSPQEIILLFKEALKYAIISDNTSGKGTIYDALASIYLKEKKVDIALDYARKSIQIREKQGAESEIQESEITYADCLVANGNYQEAKKYYFKIKNRFEKIDVKDNLIQVYLGLSYIYAYQNNGDSLFFYQRKYSKLLDQINSENNIKYSNELMTKYETEKKEKQLAEAKVDLLAKEAKIKKRTTFLISALGLAFLLGLIGFLVFKQQRLKNNQIIKENELRQALIKIENQNNLQKQRLEISKDLHDNIGSKLTFVISALDNLKYFEFTRDRLYEKFDSIGDFTRSTITDLRDTIWAMNKEEITQEDLKIRIANFIDDAREYIEGIDFEFNFDYKNQDFVIDSKTGIEIYRIIQEAVNNAIKHANATKISIDFVKNDNKTFISVSDNGSGFDINIIELGNGLNAMKKRANAINANFIIEQLKPGTKIKLIF